MYKYNYFRKTRVELEHKKRTDMVNKTANLLLKGYSPHEIAGILHLTASTVICLMTDIDDETLREALWV